MDSLTAFAFGEANRGKPLLVFDWEKAAQLIHDKKPIQASAGLKDDWEYTGGRIYEDGKPVSHEDTYVYLASTWAIPEIEIDGRKMECYRMRSDSPGGEWDAHTYWPPEAMKILEEKKT